MSTPRGPRRPSTKRGRFTSTEVTVALVFAVVAVWSTLVFVVSLRQPVLGGDFMVFYTFGTAARLGEWALQYDWPAFHRLQLSLVPTSDPYVYPPTYPPLVPALYTAFSFLPFPVAYAAWTLLSTVVYCGLCALAARDAAPLSRTQAVLAALLFPPFAAHQALGQSTIWPLMGFVGGWWAFTRSRFVLAGVILSLVAIKPHLGMALAIALLATRLWRAVAGIVLGLSGQCVATVAVCGYAAVAAYVTTTIKVLRDTTLIEPKEEGHTHAIRMTLEKIMPHDLATAVWLAASAIVAWMLITVWQRSTEWSFRVAALLLSTLLISPHVQTYDAILLAPAALWLAQWATRTAQPAVLLAVVVLSVAFVVPSARLFGLPLTVPLMGWILWRCASVTHASIGSHVPQTS